MVKSESSRKPGSRTLGTKLYNRQGDAHHTRMLPERVERVNRTVEMRKASNIWIRKGKGRNIWKCCEIYVGDASAAYLCWSVHYAHMPWHSRQMVFTTFSSRPSLCRRAPVCEANWSIKAADMLHEVWREIVAKYELEAAVISICHIDNGTYESTGHCKAIIARQIRAIFTS